MQFTILKYKIRLCWKNLGQILQAKRAGHRGPKFFQNVVLVEIWNFLDMGRSQPPAGTSKLRWVEQGFKSLSQTVFEEIAKKLNFGIHQGPNGRTLAYKWDMLLCSHIKWLVKSKLGEYSVEYGSKIYSCIIIRVSGMCRSSLDSTLPSLIHFVAIVYSFWVFRIKHSEQVEALVQKVSAKDFLVLVITLIPKNFRFINKNPVLQNTQPWSNLI